MDATTITIDGDNAPVAVASVRSVLDNADEALLVVAFVQSAGVNLVEHQLKRLGKAGRLVLTTTFSENSAALAKAFGLKTSINVLNPASGTTVADLRRRLDVFVEDLLHGCEHLYKAMWPDTPTSSRVSLSLQITDELTELGNMLGHHVNTLTNETITLG